MRKSNEETEQETARAGAATRRSLLKLGAVAAPAVVTLSPNMAYATFKNASLLACLVNMPHIVDEHGNEIHGFDGGKIVWDDERQMAGTWRKDSKRTRIFRGPPSYVGQELKDAGVTFDPTGFSTRPYEKTVSNEQFTAHLKYMQDMKNKGGIGASCLMSIAAGLNIKTI